MDYYLLSGHFEQGEASYSVLDPWRSALRFYVPQAKLIRGRPEVTVDTVYEERGMSDFLKVGLGALASMKIQTLFFQHGFSGLQFVPVEVKNKAVHQDFAFINATAHYDLLDHEASKAKKFKDSLGGYTRVRSEFIDKEKFNATRFKHDCFTLSNYKVPYFVSERVKHVLEEAKVTGVEFIPMAFA